MVRFVGAKFSGGDVSFARAKFSGGDVTFARASFSGGTVSFEDAAEWSKPPILALADPHQRGLLLPSGWVPPPPDVGPSDLFAAVRLAAPDRMVLRRRHGSPPPRAVPPLDQRPRHPGCPLAADRPAAVSPRAGDSLQNRSTGIRS